MWPLLIFLGFVLFFIWLSWKDISFTIKTDYARTNHELVVIKPDEFFNDWAPFLEKYFPYYRNLNEDGKKVFLERVQQNLRNLDIHGKENQEVNTMMRVLLMATLTQLTFGLKRYYLSSFSQIFVYPDTFFSRHANDWMDATTFKENLIALSWRHFEQGILNEADGSNLGLKEFAYALERTVYNGKRHDLYFAGYLDKWLDLADDTRSDNPKQWEALFGAHTTQRISYFPNSVVLFFEQPYAFKQTFPDLYAHLCVLLNQNPLAITENYKYTPEGFKTIKLYTQLPEKVYPSYQHVSWHWLYNTLFIGPVATPILYYLFILPNTVINIEEIFLAIGILSAVLTIAFYSYNQRCRLFRNGFFLFGFNVLGGANMLLFIMLSINLLVPIQTTTTLTHDIAYYSTVYERNQKSQTLVDLEFYFEDKYLEDYPTARRIGINDIKSYDKQFESIQFTTRRGLFGVTCITNKVIIYQDEYSGD